ncbi:restriction endonuclease subunit S [Escherichia albertii]|uniref:restriction endonuclease subunit S n=1 Tax=Escherichia albertii TaxID=208962 RepID=UPI00137535D7|nr:restriction endonuclease subunit S [Escherichia albertii]
MNAGKLPEGWVSAPVSTVTTLIRGVTYKKEQAINYLKDDYLPLIRANNIQNGKFDTTDLVFVPKNLVKESQKISPEDIVIAMSSGSKSVVGKSAHQHLPFECSFGAFCGVLRPEKLIFSGFIAHFTKSSLYRNKISSLSAGANINNIKPASFDLINIPIPPLAEQKIIAEKLDTLLAQVESTKARLEQIPQILKRFRQAVLAAAVNGHLNKTAQSNTKKRTLQEIGIIIKTGPFGSALHKSDYISNGIPVINPMHINDGIISPSLSMTISDEKYAELSSWSLQDGDIIVGRRGEMGRAAVVNIGQSKMLCGTGSMILRTKKNIEPRYLELILRSPTAISYFNKEAVGSTMVNLNQKVINSLEAYIPNVEEQREIVRRVEQLFAYADTIEKQVNNALARVNNLTQSILAKAFRGELTAQWRTENPDLISGENSAAALLEKIKAERAASGGKKASRKKS